MMPANRNKFHHAELVDPNKVVEMEMDKQNKLDDLKKQAQLQLDTIMVSEDVLDMFQSKEMERKLLY